MICIVFCAFLATTIARPFADGCVGGGWRSSGLSNSWADNLLRSVFVTHCAVLGTKVLHDNSVSQNFRNEIFTIEFK